jgi:hypothetical protein
MKFSRPQLLWILFFISIFFASLYPHADADAGWHLRYGEHLLETGTLLRENQFSWIMPDYRWVNHSWGYDLILASLNQIGGFTALSLTAALLIATSITLITRILTSQKTLHLLFLQLIIWVYFISHLYNLGLKSGLFSFLGTSILLLLLVKRPHHTHLYLPILFLIWANLHGQFIFGVAILLFYTLLQTIKPGKLRPLPFSIVAISLLATLINPFGLELYQNAISHLGHPNLQYIFEWMPWETNTPRFYFLLVFIGLHTAILFSQKNRPQNPFLLIISIIFALAALKARRLIPLYLLVAIPAVTTFLSLKIPAPKTKPLIIYQSLILIILTIFFITQAINRPIFSQNWDTLCRSTIRCSEAVIPILKKDPPMRLFNAYRLGSHLIYRLPESKVFIDGRMTLWESTTLNPFARYYQIIHAGPEALTLLTALNPDQILINNEYALNQILSSHPRWRLEYQNEFVSLYKQINN